MTWACTGIDLISPVLIAVEAATIRIRTPATIATAVAASDSKSSTNGAAMKTIAATYSITPWTKAGTGPCLNMRCDYPPISYATRARRVHAPGPDVNQPVTIEVR